MFSDIRLWNCLFCLSVDAGLALSRLARVLSCVVDALFLLWCCRALCVVFLLCVDSVLSATHATASMAQVKVSSHLRKTEHTLHYIFIYKI